MRLRRGRSNFWGPDEHDVLDVPRAQVYFNSGVNDTTSGVAWTIQWEAAAYDSDGMWKPATNTRLTARTAGLYAWWCSIAWVNNAFGDRDVYFIKNGTFAFGTSYSPTTTTFPHFQVISFPQPMNAGDYVEVRILQNSAVNLALYGTNGNNGFAGCLISTT